MFAWLHSSRRTLAAAAIVLFVGQVGGCAFFEKENWNLDRYRDERAVDIEKRLERAEPIVQNPF